MALLLILRRAPRTARGQERSLLGAGFLLVHCFEKQRRELPNKSRTIIVTLPKTELSYPINILTFLEPKAFDIVQTFLHVFPEL